MFWHVGWARQATPTAPGRHTGSTARLRRTRRHASAPEQATDLSGLTDEELRRRLDFVLAPTESELEPLPYLGPPVEQIAEEASQGEYVQFAEGPRGFPIVKLRHNDGAEAVVHLQGGHVSSWTDQSGLEMLHLHPDNDFNPSRAISGGVAFEFPKVGSGMPGMPHGLTTPLGGILAETHFQLAASHCDEDALDNSPGVTLFAESTQDSRDLWPHDWAMTYTISLCSDDDPVSPFAEPQYTHVEPDDVPDLDTGDPELILPVDDEGPFSREEILKGNSQTDFMIDEMLPSLPVLRPVHDDDSDDEDAGSGAEDGEEEDSGESDTEAGDVSGGAEGGAAAALDDAAASGAESGDKDGESLSDEARELLGDYASGVRSEIKDGDAKAMDSDAEVEFDSDDDAIDSDEEEGGELAADMGDSEDDSGEEEDEASSSEEEEDEEEEVKYDRNDPDIVVPPSQLKFSIAIQNTGAETMVFQAGTFADLTHRDCTQNEGVRVRGLGRKHALDFSRGKTPTVVETDGYFTPVAEPPGARLEAVWPNAAKDADVMLCTGETQFYKLVFREGYTDAAMRHPDLAAVPLSKHYTTLGGGAISVPVELPPGETWIAEFSYRKYYEYWDKPVFETSGTPLPGRTEAYHTEEVKP